MTTLEQPCFSHTGVCQNFVTLIKSIFVRGKHRFIDNSHKLSDKSTMSTQKIHRLAKKITRHLEKIQAPASSTFATAGQICALCDLTTQMINAFNAEQAKELSPGSSTYYQLVPNRSGQPECVLRRCY